MSWDQDPQVLSPVGRPMSEQMAEGQRRQPLDGFEAVYRDIVDYIVRCTHRIWEEKDVGLCRTHYGADCTLHTLAGPAVGMEVVTQNTIGALAAYADRVVLAEDVIWSEDAPGTYYSSHRIMSRSTHFGDEPLIAGATMRGSGTTTIADCKVIANKIVEEWLVRDNIRALWQVGADPRALAEAQAVESDREGDQARHDWRKDMIRSTREEASVAVPDGHPAVGSGGNAAPRVRGRSLRGSGGRAVARGRNPLAVQPARLRAGVLDRLRDAASRDAARLHLSAGTYRGAPVAAR